MSQPHSHDHAHGAAVRVVDRRPEAVRPSRALILHARTLEVLRPLVGMDKDEISAEARAIGTFPISIIPDQDCCQLFTPRHPATRAHRDEVVAAEAALAIEAMTEAAAAALR